MKMSDQEIASRIKSFAGWEVQDDRLTKTFRFHSYMEGVDFVNQIAAAAESLQHHPDLLLGYCQVKVAVTTHDEGGITEKDFELIRRIERG
ncbi:4a-hydroxytetrahydrobiopterin dehydratase [Salinithrix halophila]|uniref:4a-hydroxytetrahydrobiopterin dehydratase n=1 Tax=Salinithrix halophila TaxID=1485204 RepID=A0ABV8JHD5_9BACL